MSDVLRNAAMAIGSACIICKTDHLTFFFFFRYKNLKFTCAVEYCTKFSPCNYASYVRGYTYQLLFKIFKNGPSR
jgi:hypothetical protein